MAVSFIGASNLIKTNGTAPGAITPHASSTTGDLLMFFHYSRATGGNETVTSPTGFVDVFNTVTANNGLVCVASRQYTTGTFTATITNHTSGNSGETVLEWIETYRGHDSAAPIPNFTASLSTWASSLNIGSIAAPATATVHDGDMVVVFGGRFENVTGQTVLTGDSLTWATRTLCDSALGLDAGAVTQNGLNSSGSNQTVTAKTITTTGTAQAGAGRMFIIEKTPAQNYTLPIVQGSYTYTGQIMNLLKGYRVTIDQGFHTLTGQTINFLRGYLVSFTQGTYTLTGQAINLLTARIINFAQGSYTLTGQAINFAKGFIMAFAQGSYVLTGQAINLVSARLLSISQGVYILSGQTMGLIRGFTLIFAQGSYVLTGQAIGLLRTYFLSIIQGSYSLAGQTISLIFQRLPMAITTGIYALAGQVINLIYAPLIINKFLTFISLIFRTYPSFRSQVFTKIQLTSIRKAPISFTTFVTQTIQKTSNIQLKMQFSSVCASAQ